MDLASRTPAEIDTELAALYGQEGKAAQGLAYARAAVHRAAGDKQTGSSWDRNGRQWQMSWADAVAAAQRIADTDETYIGRDAVKAMERLAEAEQAVADVLAAQEPLHQEFYRRGGWTRAFIVQNAGGHVHKDMNCSTCFPTTSYGWLPQVSGLTESEIVAKAGSDACTVCYPSAPVETLARARTIFSADEETERAAAAARKAEKDARAAAKAAKAIAHPDGQPLLDGHGWKVETEVTAQRSLVEILANAQSFGYDRQPAVEQRLAEALAAKRGVTVEDLMVEIEKKVTAKVKRDRR